MPYLLSSENAFSERVMHPYPDRQWVGTLDKPVDGSLEAEAVVQFEVDPTAVAESEVRMGVRKGCGHAQDIEPWRGPRIEEIIRYACRHWQSRTDGNM